MAIKDLPDNEWNKAIAEFVEWLNSGVDEDVVYVDCQFIGYDDSGEIVLVASIPEDWC